MSNNPTKLTASDLAALMCARICHDLVSPIGALGAALEVLDDESNSDMHDDAMELIRSSAGQAANKLKYLRLAFGAGTSAPGVVGLEQLRSMVQDMYGEGKAEIAWNTELDGVEKSTARLLLNLVMVALQSIPRGGTLTIDVTRSPDSDLISLKAEGPKARIYEEFEKALNGKAPAEGFDGRSIQPFYTGMLVRQLKGRLDWSLTDETVQYSVFIPHEAAQSAA